MGRRRFAPALIVLLSTGCGSSAPTGPEELRGQLRELISLTAEADLFDGFVRQGHATDVYTTGHGAYLRERARKLADELTGATPAPATQSALPRARDLASRAEQLVQQSATHEASIHPQAVELGAAARRLHDSL